MSNEGSTSTGSRLTRPWFLALGLAFLATACAPEADDTADSRFEGEEPMAEMSDEERRRATDGMTRDDETMQTGEANQLVRAETGTYGEYVAYPDGRPIYLFTADTKGQASACYDACAEAWPPVTGDLATAAGLDASLLGTIIREDGTRQVTYAGWPLYEFTRDEAGSEPQGQEIESFGGEWYLIGANGERVHGSGATAEEAPADATDETPSGEPSENR